MLLRRSGPRRRLSPTGGEVYPPSAAPEATRGWGEGDYITLKGKVKTVKFVSVRDLRLKPGEVWKWTISFWKRRWEPISLTSAIVYVSDYCRLK